MHRHGYKGRKLGRERDQRRALIKSLADSLIRDESIVTTESKAKELVPYFEKLVTKAKKGGLHNRRQIIASLMTVESSNKLVDDIAPKLSARNSGYLRIKRTEIRRGDHTQMAKVSFVDDLSKTVKKAEETKPAVKPEAKKPAAKTAKAPAKPKTAPAKKTTGAKK